MDFGTLLVDIFFVIPTILCLMYGPWIIIWLIRNTADC